MPTAMADWQEEEARTETIFREMNEWTVEANDERAGVPRLMDSYLCECSDRGCTEPIHLTRPEYEAVRAEPVRFAIAVNHENPELDRVLAENARFATVEKFSSVGVRIARASDPRRRIGTMSRDITWRAGQDSNLRPAD